MDDADEADGQGDARAVEDARQDVAAQVVGAQQEHRVGLPAVSPRIARRRPVRPRTAIDGPEQVHPHRQQSPQPVLRSPHQQPHAVVLAADARVAPGHVVHQHAALHLRAEAQLGRVPVEGGPVVGVEPERRGGLVGRQELREQHRPVQQHQHQHRGGGHRPRAQPLQEDAAPPLRRRGLSHRGCPRSGCADRRPPAARRRRSSPAGSGS